MYKDKEKEKAYREKYRHDNAEKIRIKSKKYSDEHREERLEKRRVYREKNREELKRQKAIKKPIYRENEVLKIYGLKKEEQRKMLLEQGGKCAICGKDNFRKGKIVNLCVDHDHKTGRIRELICSKCNSALAFARDDVEILEKASKYLLENNEISAIIKY